MKLGGTMGVCIGEKSVFKTKNGQKHLQINVILPGG